MAELTHLWTAQEIIDILSAHRAELRAMGVVKIGLFGSFRHGTATPDSDLDFVVVLERPSFDDYMDARIFLEDLFGHKVDLVLEENIKPRIRSRIMSEAMYAPGL